MTPPSIEPTPSPFPAPERAKPSAPSLLRRESDGDLVRRTLRTVAVLVTACVLFVGVLSILAVTMTSRAFGTSAEAKANASGESAKKPLSI